MLYILKIINLLDLFEHQCNIILCGEYNVHHFAVTIAITTTLMATTPLKVRLEPNHLVKIPVIRTPTVIWKVQKKLIR